MVLCIGTFYYGMVCGHISRHIILYRLKCLFSVMLFGIPLINYSKHLTFISW